MRVTFSCLGLQLLITIKACVMCWLLGFISLIEDLQVANILVRVKNVEILMELSFSFKDFFIWCSPYTPDGTIDSV